MPKELGPLPKATKEADLLKKRVDKLVKECNKTLDNTKLKDKEEKLKQLYKNCFDLKQEVTPVLNRVTELKEEDEPSKIKNYANKKNFETKRLETWQRQLGETMTKLQPDENEEQYLKKMRREAGEASEEEEEEGEEEVEEEEDVEEEEEEEEEEETAKDKPKDKPTVAKKEEEEEESVEEEEDEEEEEEEEETKPAKKEVTTKTKTKKTEDEEEEEEEEAEEEEEEEEEDEEEDEEEEEEEDEAEAESGQPSKVELTQSMRQFVAIDNYEGEEGDLSFKIGDVITVLETRDDGWWVAENSDGEKGLVPSTYLQLYNKYKNVQQQDDEEEDEEEEEEEETGDVEKTGSSKAQKLWGSIKKAVNETTVSDVLHAMGAVPSGFRPSTLSRLFNEGDIYRMKNYLAPKLSPSNLSYRDLFFDPSSNKIRPRVARVERVVTLLSCQQIPPPGSGIDVQSRHVRMCLFDGQTILSNIHTVKVSSTDKSERTWSFTTRVSDTMDTFYHADTFVRTNNTVDNLGILFELCVSYTRSSTEEKGEFSCGWVHLPLLDQGGALVPSKTYDLYMNGGTPYEKGVEVDPSISRRAGSSALVSLISGNKQPRLHVRVAIPKNDQKQNLDQLPDTLVGNMCLLPFYCYHRQLLADVLLRDRLDLDSTELIHSPTLATFPRVADQHDLMKLLRDSWVARTRTVKRVERRDEEFMKDTFKQVFTESVYPLTHIVAIPPYVTGDTDVEEVRHKEIEKFRQQKLERKSALAALLSSDIVFTPFDLQEVAFNVVGPHCLVKTVHVTTVES